MGLTPALSRLVRVTLAGMRVFPRHWRWWLRGGAAGVFVLSILGAALFFLTDSDGSAAALEQIQLGMAREQALAVLSSANPSGQDAADSSRALVQYRFRSHIMWIVFDENGRVVGKSRASYFAILWESCWLSVRSAFRI
jgi:hypothetical protein